MSLRLVGIWLYGKPYHHTTIDDLESFLWLTVWCIYCIIEDKGELDERDETALWILRSTDIRVHDTGRRRVLDFLSEDEDPLHPLLVLFQPLLLQWRHISQAGAREITKLLRTATSPENDALRDLTHKYFKVYLNQGFSYLANFPRSWEVYFPHEG